MEMLGYLRKDGRVGVRNHIAVVFTVECSHHVAAQIAAGVSGGEVWGFPGCYSDPHAVQAMVACGAHPNVGGVLLVSLGCEGTDLSGLAHAISQSGQAVEVLRIQEAGGTLKTIERGIAVARGLRAHADQAERVAIGPQDLIVGVECGGSDTTSGLAANPATGHAIDLLVAAGGTAIFSELPELLGCEQYLSSRGETPAVREQILAGIRRAVLYSRAVGEFAVSPGNRAGGLTTIEEKSLGALCKAGTRPVKGVLKPIQRPDGPGLWLLDKVGDPDDHRLTYYEENDNDGLMSLIASGAHLLLFTTGRGSVVGSVVSPVIKICGNPKTVARMGDNFDADAGRIITGEAEVDQVGRDIYATILRTAGGEPTRAEVLGHREFHLPYKPARACDL